MEKNQYTTDLVCILEEIIGQQVSNSNASNWGRYEGCDYRYPISYCVDEEDYKHQKVTKTKNRIRYITPNCIGSMRYEFGSNHLYIGNGIVKILEFLEDRYKIDFNEFETDLIEKRKESMFSLAKELNKKDYIYMEPGKYKIGIDIPIGKYTIRKVDYKYWLMLIYNSKGEVVIKPDSDINEFKILLEEDQIILAHTPFEIELIGFEK